MQECGHQLTRRRLLTGVGAGLTATLIGTSSSAVQAQTEGSGEQLSFGETFVSPTDIALTVNGVELTDSYEWGSGGSTFTEEAPEGMQFAWVYLTVENRADQPQYLPFGTEIAIRAGNQQFDASFPLRNDGQYQSSQVGPSVVREGWLYYEIPSDLSVSDLSVVWYGTNFVDEWTATWSGEASSGTTSPTGSPTTTPQG